MKKVYIKKIIWIIVLVVSVISSYWFIFYPRSYRDYTAIKNGDIVYAADGLHNLELFEKWMKAVDNAEEFDPIRVTVYSKEGFPTIYDISFDGKTIQCEIDNTRNLFGREYKKSYGEFTGYELRTNRDYFLVDDSEVYQDRYLFQNR